jgi:hypothetical protein
LNAALQGYYLGDAHIIDKDFSNSTRVDMPHFGNTFSIDASQLIWKGGMVKNGIKAQSLKAELTELNYQSNEQHQTFGVGLPFGFVSTTEPKISISAEYPKLAEQRLQNINKFYNQGMVTK